MTIIVIIIDQGLIDTSGCLAGISNVVFDQDIFEKDIRGAAIIRVLTQEVIPGMSPGMISNKAIIPLFTKFAFSKGKRLANDHP